MVGVTSPNDIDNYMAIMGMPYGGYHFLSSLPDSDHSQYFTYKVTDRRAVREVAIKHGRPVATVRIFIEGHLVENIGKPITNTLIQKVENINELAAKKNIVDLIKRTQKNQADIFAFGEEVRGRHPSFWKEHVRTIEKWRKIYEDMPIDVKVVIKIRRIGTKDN